MAVEIPHFTLPFQWARGVQGGVQVSVAEQESVTEIAGCAEAIIRTVQGQRTSLPEFGRPELEFATDPDFVRTSLATALIAFEPRVESLIESASDPNDEELQIVRALIAPRDTEEGDAL